MNAKTSNPAALGLAAFALTTWLLSMINAGWFSGDSMGMVLAVALAYGGTAQALAGLMEIPRGNTFGATAFLSYGAFWWFFRSRPVRGPRGKTSRLPDHSLRPRRLVGEFCLDHVEHFDVRHAA